MMFVKEFIVRLQDGKNRIEYRDVFMSRNKERILKVRFSITLGDYLMQLIADPDSLVPLPLMILTQTPARNYSVLITASVISSWMPLIKANGHRIRNSLMMRATASRSI